MYMYIQVVNRTHCASGGPRFSLASFSYRISPIVRVLLAFRRGRSPSIIILYFARLVYHITVVCAENIDRHNNMEYWSVRIIIIIVKRNHVRWLTVKTANRVHAFFCTTCIVVSCYHTVHSTRDITHIG